MLCDLSKDLSYLPSHCPLAVHAIFAVYHASKGSPFRGRNPNFSSEFEVGLQSTARTPSTGLWICWKVLRRNPKISHTWHPRVRPTNLTEPRTRQGAQPSESTNFLVCRKYQLQVPTRRPSIQMILCNLRRNLRHIPSKFANVIPHGLSCKPQLPPRP